MLRRFGSTDKSAREVYSQFLRDGLKENEESDRLIDLVRKSNAGSESGRKAGCWVIGDHKFVREVTASTQARRLRISRFEQEGGGFDDITETINAIFDIPVEMLQRRQRGGIASEARKVFSFSGQRI